MIKYRSEIDGLRAVAVLSVLFFHAGFGIVPGGFVGVDVFFVISGFLITSIIMKESLSGEFTYSRFYERRIRRLLPPLIPVLLASLVGAFLLLNTPQFGEFVHSCYAAVGFVANWFFLSSVDYFDGPGELTPLLHIWSLSIEEQFYFVFPVLFIFFLKKSQKSVIPVFALIALASLAYSTYLLANNMGESAFFNSPARFWELLVGSILAMIGSRKPATQAACDIFEVVGVSLIVVPVLFYTKESYFPGVAALLPTIGTALIIYAAGGGRFVSPILKSKAFVSVGLVSYSLYLWHWPILVYTKMVWPGAGHLMMLCGLLVALLLAVASYYFIEGPIRRKQVIKSRNSAYSFALMTAFLVVGISYAANSDNASAFRVDTFAKVRGYLFSGDRPDVLAKIEQEKNFYLNNLNINYTGETPKFDLSVHSGWTCSFDKGNSADRIFDCLKSQDKTHSVLVMGDSIARDTMHSLRRAYPKVNFVALHQSSCPPGDVGGRCFSKSGELLDKVGRELKFDAVIINFRYRPKEWKNVESGIEAAKSVSKNVILFGVSPMFAKPASDYIKSLPDGADIPVFISEQDKKLTQWSYSEIAVEAKAMADKHGVKFVSLLDFFCPAGKCRLWVDNRPGDPLYIDEQHLTNKGIDEFGAFLKTQEQVKSVL